MENWIFEVLRRNLTEFESIWWLGISSDTKIKVFLIFNVKEKIRILFGRLGEFFEKDLRT